MGDIDPNDVEQSVEQDIPIPSSSSIARRQSDGLAFHSQFDHFTQHQSNPTQNVNPYGQHSFDLGALVGALPHSGQSPMSSQPQYGSSDAPGMFPPASLYHMQHALQYPSGQGMQVDAGAAARAQQHYLSRQYGSLPQQPPMMPRQTIPFQTQNQYNQFDPYAFGMSHVQVPTLDPRFAPPSPFGVAPNAPGDFGQVNRRASEPAPIPFYPRGPPRKPKQSGYALWVGNLPPAATVTDLKDHFSRDATKEIESLFLISKSNCAFVNYRSETACMAAMNRFHDSRFNGVRLVCRLRRGGAVVGVGAGAGQPAAGSEPPPLTSSPAGAASPAVIDEPTNPTIVGSSPTPTSSAQAAAGSAASDAPKVSEKYFIVKSLTVQDLEASVRNRIWATQSHNETVLNRAYDEADNVFLIFSANKSGEYFGYARMTSTISGEPVSLSSSSTPEEPLSTGVPQSIPTAATATAPRGRIIDDSARGTIFWEAEHSDEDDDESPEKYSGEGQSEQSWGRQFAIEWISTARLPFYRTRGLRNPWNANREVKIARDGTELEPTVGRRLVQMFHRPSPSPGLAPLQAGMPYR